MDNLTATVWLLLNIPVLLLYDYDKLASKTGKARLRISERALLLAAALGGLGALAGMRLFRHKTRHRSFRILIPLFAAAQAALMIFIHIRFG